MDQDLEVIRVCRARWDRLKDLHGKIIADVSLGRSGCGPSRGSVWRGRRHHHGACFRADVGNDSKDRGGDLAGGRGGVRTFGDGE